MTSIDKFSIESKFLKWDINIHLINKKNFDIIMTFNNYYFLIISDYNLSITKIKPSRINFKRLFFHIQSYLYNFHIFLYFLTCTKNFELTVCIIKKHRDNVFADFINGVEMNSRVFKRGPLATPMIRPSW